MIRLASLADRLNMTEAGAALEGAVLGKLTTATSSGDKTVQTFQLVCPDWPGLELANQLQTKCTKIQTNFSGIQTKMSPMSPIQTMSLK